LKLNPGANPKEKESAINNWIEDQFGEDLKQRGISIFFSLAKLNDLHFDTVREMHGTVPTINILYLQLLAFAGLLLIMVGAANYINLTNAESSERYKEIGMRKIIGANRTQIFTQYFIESVL
jgi:putative ABC transport system permease protein